MQEYIAMWKNYANFHDRTTVRGYWMVFLINFIIGAAFGVLETAGLSFVSYLSSLYILATLIPGLAICIRRLRDSGKKWTYLFIGLIPLVGWILLIVQLCKPSTPEYIEGAATV